MTNDQQSQTVRTAPLCFQPTIPSDSANPFTGNPRKGLLFLEGIRHRYGRAGVSGVPERGGMCKDLLEYSMGIVERWSANAVRCQDLPGAPDQTREIAALDAVLAELGALTPASVLAWFESAEQSLS